MTDGYQTHGDHLPVESRDFARPAVVADPEGARFGVVEASAGDPQDFLADPDDWIWIQLLSCDGRKAAKFYRPVPGVGRSGRVPGRRSFEMN